MIGGFFPFSQTAFPVHLGPGGTYYFPPGQYVISLGRTSILQVMNSNQGNASVWRSMGPPNRTLTLNTTDGCNYRILNNSGTVTGALITNAGTSGTNGIGAMATGCSISFGAAPSAGRAATCYPIVGGSINTTITITTAGTGLVVPPLLVFDPPPPGGISPTAYCTLSSGTIGAVTVTNPGAGYTTAPNCYVIPQWGQYPGGTIAGVDPPAAVAPYTSITQNALLALQARGTLVGAWTTTPVLTVNATLGGDGTLTGIGMLDYGSNYISSGIPTISFTGGPTSAAATAIMSFCVTSVSVANAGVALAGNASGWTTTDGLVAATDGFSTYYGIRPATGITTLSSTTTTILTSFTVEDPGYGLQKVPQVLVGAVPGVAPTTNPGGTAVCGGIVDTTIIQPAVA